ncbi:MAG: hypothetical protein R3308_06825 [Thiohalobacterales bacterium]|nr:hypothetical protein [Thiohalobacterales bacterium]
MDCYIVRIYRHIAGSNGKPDEVAGLLESVGSQEQGKPFSTYNGLVDAIRDSFRTRSTDEGDSPEYPDNDIRAAR